MIYMIPIMCHLDRLTVICLIVVGLLLGYGHSESRGKRNKNVYYSDRLKKFFDTLLDGYDKRIRPGLLQNDTTVVNCSIWIKSVNQMDDKKMVYRVHFYFYQAWYDFRLARNTFNESISIDSQFENSIWLPDTYFRNAQVKEEEWNPLDSYEPIEDSRLLKLYPNGLVEYDKRYVMTFYCFLDFRSYPMDEQRCKMEIESYGTNVENLRYEWQENVRILPLNMLEMEIVSSGSSTCNSTYSTGVFSCLRVELTFRRRLQYFGLQVYFPMIAITIISWLGFWIDIRNSSARISMGMLTSLALVTNTMNALSQVPRTPYIKSVDVWCLGCVFFVFSTLMEFTLAYQATRKADETENRRKIQLFEYDYRDDEDSGIPNFRGARFSTFNSTVFRNRHFLDDTGSGNSQTSLPAREDDAQDFMFGVDYRDWSLRIERTSRFLYPLGFLTFNVIYWSIYYVRWT